MLIYLDMDGVCVNFVKGACIAHNYNYADVIESWPKGTYNICKILGISESDFWTTIVSWGEQFWLNLQAYTWYSKLASLPYDIVYLSTPTLSPFSVSGKLSWLQAQYGHRFRDYIFTPHKHLLAKSGGILIDDSESNVNKYIEAGGRAILFPQPWNHGIEVEDRTDYLFKQLTKPMSMVEARCLMNGTGCHHKWSDWKERNGFLIFGKQLPLERKCLRCGHVETIGDMR